MDVALKGFTRWPKARDVASTVEVVARSLGLDPALVMGMIATESEFNAMAYRSEAAINDASRGLMQILYRTAKAVGYAGEPDGLYPVEINVRFGGKYLRDSIKAHGGDVWAGVSAYNNGNGKRATKDTVVCDWRKADGTCGASHPVKAGDFFNQPYVNKVKSNAALFGYSGPAVAGAPGGVVGVLLILGIGLALAKRFTS
jgi:soluble lytic murein transglycosylase-like protein